VWWLSALDLASHILLHMRHSSLGCLFICAAAFQGMYEWLERFFYLLGMVVVSIAYFLNGFMYREETRLN
jgi:hypothetical protein